MQKIKSNCLNRLDRILKSTVNRDILNIITEFLHQTDIKTGTILIDSAYFIPATAHFRDTSQKLFVVTRRTKCMAYIRELTKESAYRKRYFNRLGQMSRVISHPYDNRDRVWIYTPDEVPQFKFFVRLCDNIKDLQLPICVDIDYVKDRYKVLSQYFC